MNKNDIKSKRLRGTFRFFMIPSFSTLQLDRVFEYGGSPKCSKGRPTEKLQEKQRDKSVVKLQQANGRDPIVFPAK